MPANLPLIYGLPSLLDRLMNSEETTAFPATDDMRAKHFPPVQVLESENAVHVRALLPGIAPDKVTLVLEAGVLTIRGDIPAPQGVQLRRERDTGPFWRRVELPCPVADCPPKASMRYGVLTVILPKALSGKKRIHVGRAEEENPEGSHA